MFLRRLAVRRARVAALAVGLVVSLIAGSGVAQDGPLWTHWNRRELRAASEVARFQKGRVLIGLSGGELCCVSEHLVDGPLAKILADDEVLTAAEPFTRLLVKDPEAMLLERGQDTRWPSLLVLDPDGRRVDALQFVPQVPRMVSSSAVAHFLEEAASATPEERFQFQLDDPESAAAGALAAEWGARPGVRRARVLRGRLILRADPGVVAPSALLNALAAAEIEGELVQPRAVTLTPGEGAASLSRVRRWLAQVAGVWAVDELPPEVEDGPVRLRAWMPAHMLDPDALTTAARRWEADAATEDFRFETLPEGREAAATAGRIFDLTGVLAVHADLFDRRIRIVVRSGATSREALLASLLEWGCRLPGDVATEDEESTETPVRPGAD